MRFRFRIGVITILVILLFGYQNCSQVSFQSLPSEISDPSDPPVHSIGDIPSEVVESKRSLMLSPQTESVQPKVKVLLLVDNSDSMLPQQQYLSRGVETLLDGLRGFEIEFFITTTHNDVEDDSLPAPVKTHVIYDRVNPNGTFTTLLPQPLVAPSTFVYRSREFFSLFYRKENGVVKAYEKLTLHRNIEDSAFEAFKLELKNKILAVGADGSPTEQGLCTLHKSLLLGDLVPDSQIFTQGDKAAFVILSNEMDQTSPEKCVIERNKICELSPTSGVSETRSCDTAKESCTQGEYNDLKMQFIDRASDWSRARKIEFKYNGARTLSGRDLSFSVEYYSRFGTFSRDGRPIDGYDENNRRSAIEFDLRTVPHSQYPTCNASRTCSGSEKSEVLNMLSRSGLIEDQPQAGHIASCVRKCRSNSNVTETVTTELTKTIQHPVNAETFYAKTEMELYQACSTSGKVDCQTSEVNEAKLSVGGSAISQCKVICEVPWSQTTEGLVDDATFGFTPNRNICGLTFSQSGTSYSGIYDYLSKTRLADKLVSRARPSSACQPKYSLKGIRRDVFDKCNSVNITTISAYSASDALVEKFEEKASQMFGDKGYFVSAIINDSAENVKYGCQMDASQSYGTQYRDLARSSGSVQSICETDYSPSLNGVKNFIETAVLNTLRIEGVQPGEIVTEVYRLRSGKEQSMELGKVVSLIGHSLQFAQGQLQPGDKIRVVLVSRQGE